MGEPAFRGVSAVETDAAIRSFDAVPVVSFEYFPGRYLAQELSLWDTMQRLAPLSPAFVSMTCGAVGSTQTDNRELVSGIQRRFGVPAAAHMTCAGGSRDEVLELARGYWTDGIRHIVALRGDPPGGAGTYVPRGDGFAYASDLVAALRKLADFEISVAAYPETHPSSLSAKHDLDNLKRKIDAGATRAITQFFFDNDVFLRFRDACAAARIEAPIVPGILPIERFPQMVKFAERCGTTIPAHLPQRFEGLDNDAETHRAISINYAIEQVKRLRAEGVGHFHFYTLNRAEQTYAICHALGVRPALIRQTGV